jgi:AcrR family transcriptional regulator
MVQRKKEEVRDAILKAAFKLFTEEGFSDTRVPAIAREAGMSTANLYVYFSSKMEILFTLYSPWLRQRLERIEIDLKGLPTTQLRLQKLLTALWHDLPKEDNGFTHNVIEAVSSKSSHDEYSPELRNFFVSQVARWLEEYADLDSSGSGHMATVIVMAFDGFATNVRLEHGVACTAEMVELFSGLILGRVKAH